MMSLRPAAGMTLALAFTVSCAAHRVLVPPRLDLVPYGSVGLVTFTIEKGKGSLPELATRRFSEEILAAQTGIEIQELGAAEAVLRRVGETSLGPDAARALGGDQGVPAVFFGHLKISDVKPKGGLIGLTMPHIEATVSAELSVELLSTRTGGTLWRASAATSEKVGGLAIIGGEPYFSAQDPNQAYGHLVDRLVAAVTRDLRPTWVKQ
jgi:hypothetical protein